MGAFTWRHGVANVAVAVFACLSTSLPRAFAVSTSNSQGMIYSPGSSIPVECLNRTIESGEHVADEHGVLQFIPFLSCKETQKPLAFTYLSEETVNCTIESMSDEIFHLWEFYVHHDSPLTCRVPMRPTEGQVAGEASHDKDWIPLVISLSGKLDSSHLHISTSINLIFHTGELASDDEDATPGTIDSATAYSVSPLTKSIRVIIGDPLKLQFTIRWYTGSDLPPSDSRITQWGKNRKYGGHVTPHTLAYCMITAICTAAMCTAYFLGWEFPKRMRRMRTGDRGGGGGVGGIGAGSIGQFIGRMGTPLGGFSMGPGKAGGYGILPGNSANGEGGSNWYTKKD